MTTAAFLFAACDLLIRVSITRWQDHWGYTMYATVCFGVTSLCGLLLLQRFVHAQVPWGKVMPITRGTLRKLTLLLAGSAVVMLAAQYCLFASFASGKNATLSNILYNTRGVFLLAAMAFLVLGQGSTVERAGRVAYTYRTIGVLVTLAASAIAILL